ncbi:Uncharacterised protein [Mycobacterium tuberculosis]|nr:Uncharacterised protein [Mycobacterium tuberculosis]
MSGSSVEGVRRPTGEVASSPRPGPGKQAQVRLSPEEMEDPQKAMRTLHLESASDALRAGLQLRVHEAAEVRAAEEIGAFNAGVPAPLPEGAVAPADAELEEADKLHW